MPRAGQPASASTTSSPATAGLEPRWLAEQAGGRLLRRGSLRIAGAAVDSRRVEAGNAFFALPGEQTDGHRFLESAVAAGAAALVVSEDLTEARLDALGGADAAVSIVRVADGAAALRAVAAAHRARFDPLVVGITGSLAKTSTKEQTAEVLAERFRVLRSSGNENNEIGLPLTLLRLGPEHEAAVLEMGLYATGEIALLARLATAVHRRRHGRPRRAPLARRARWRPSRPASASSWRRCLRPAGPSSTPTTRGSSRMAEATPARVLRYGFDPAADVRAEDVRSLGVDGMRFRLRPARWRRGGRDAGPRPARRAQRAWPRRPSATARG